MLEKGSTTYVHRHHFGGQSSLSFKKVVRKSPVDVDVSIGGRIGIGISAA